MTRAHRHNRRAVASKSGVFSVPGHTGICGRHLNRHRAEPCIELDAVHVRLGLARRGTCYNLRTGTTRPGRGWWRLSLRPMCPGVCGEHGVRSVSAGGGSLPLVLVFSCSAILALHGPHMNNAQGVYMVRRRPMSVSDSRVVVEKKERRAANGYVPCTYH